MPYAKTKDGSLVNEVTLGDGYPLSNDLKPLKIGGEASILEISSPLPDGSDNGQIKVNGDLDITGTLKTKLSHDLIYDFDDEVNTLAQVKIDALIDSAPAALDTLNELAAALNDDASFSTTITNSLATKVGLTGNETIAGVKTFSSSLDLTGIPSDPADGDTVRIGRTDAYTSEILQINSNDGYLRLGAYNASYCHFVTDRPMFYFNQDIAVDTGLISSFNEDLIIRRVFNDTSYNQITLGDDSFELKLDNTARLSVDGDGHVGIGTTSPNAELHLHSASGAGNLWITGEGSNPAAAGNLRFAEQEDGNNFFQFSHDGNMNTLSVDSNNQSDMTVWDRSNNRVTHGAQNRFYRAYPQVRYSDDSGTDSVEVGLSGNSFFHKGSDDDVNFLFRNSNNDDILFIDSGLKGIGINDTSVGSYALKIGGNGRMNMPMRGLEFENAHGYFSPLGDMFLPLFINTTQVDLIRFQTPITWEYWNYTSNAWVDDSSNVSGLQNMLDGRRTSTYSVTNTKRKFRFVIERAGSWADDHLFYIENTWSSIGTWTTNASGGGSLTPTMVVERLDGSFDASDDTNNDWTTNSGITTDWHTTGIWDQFGMAMYYSTGMHNTEKHIRVTVTFPEYADTSKTISIKNIGVLSSYSSASRNQEAFVQDFNRNATGYGHVYIPSGHSYNINSNTCLSETGLGSTVVNSSLTSVGTLGSLTVSGDATFDTTTLKVDSSNNRVGIGTASPGQGLHVVDTGAIVAEFESSDNTTSIIHIENSAGEDGYIGVTNDGLVFSGQNYNSNNMIVDTSGNVGIGTTSPASALHVEEGDIRIDAAASGNVALRFSEVDNTRAQIQYKSFSEELNFITDDASGSDVTRMTIKSEQDATAVGIGTTGPTTTLDVEGTVSYKHISITDGSDALDVSGCTVIESTPSGTDRIGGLTGGVQGQVIHILKVDSGLGRLIIENNEGTGNQDIFLSSGADVMLSARGGITLYCNGTSWFGLDK